jgi:hypothetical protein
MKDPQVRKVKFSSHAIQRMFERQISIANVLEAIDKGEIINSYPNDKPYPSYLSLFMIEKRPIHVVYAENLEENEIIVITVYIPDEKNWSHDFKSRR